MENKSRSRLLLTLNGVIGEVTIAQLRELVLEKTPAEYKECISIDEGEYFVDPSERILSAEVQFTGNFIKGKVFGKLKLLIQNKTVEKDFIFCSWSGG